MGHGVKVSEQTTGIGTPVVAESGIPFVIGAAPVQSANAPVAAGTPVLCTSYDEALAALGYSDDWAKYNLCEFMYSHFKLFELQPVIFCNMLDTGTMKEAVTAADKAVADHKIKLPIAAIDNATLVIKAAGGAGDAYEKDEDYSTYYDGEYLVIELLSTGSIYAAASLSVAYNQVTPASVTTSVVAAGMENIEKCLTLFRIVPDLIVSPGYSENATVAAVMNTKAGGINGMFIAKALTDISTASSGGADVYSEVAALKASNNLTDKNQIVCWPLIRHGSKVYRMSTQLAGLMAKVDTENRGIPYESPSNKPYFCDALVDAAGNEINLLLAQANILNEAGVVTALNFLNGFTCWGNYTACYPANTDVKDHFIPLTRMFAWIGNTEVKTFWAKLDKPMKRRLIDSILDSLTIWLNGLVGAEYLYGARAEFKDSENPLADLMAGKIKIHNYATPPSPMQEIEFVLEYDASYVSASL